MVLQFSYFSGTIKHKQKNKQQLKNVNFIVKTEWKSMP